MKKYILLALTGILLFTSCDDFLDRTPKSDLAPENYFRDKKDMIKNHILFSRIIMAFLSFISHRQSSSRALTGKALRTDLPLDYFNAPRHPSAH